MYPALAAYAARYRTFCEPAKQVSFGVYHLNVTSPWGRCVAYLADCMSLDSPRFLPVHQSFLTFTALSIDLCHRSFLHFSKAMPVAQ
jgi:hypothetical protein